MKMMDRYIGRYLVTHILGVLFALLALYFFSTIIAEMNNTGRGSYTTVDAVLYSLMLLPRQAYELFPLVALVGTILGMGAMANNNELTILRTAGVSVSRLATSVMKTGLVIIAVVIVMGETVAPYLEKQAHAQRLAALARSVSMHSEEGLWARDGDDYINIQKLVPGGRASGIKRYSFSDGRLTEMTSAQRGMFDGDTLVVQQIIRTRFDDNGVSVEKHGQEKWRSTLTPEVINVATLLPENLALWELYDFIAYLRDNGLATQRYETAMWVRVFTPLATGGMILLALPFIFGSLRAVTIGHRVMIGSLLGIVFYLVNGIFSRLGMIYDITPFISAGTPTVLVFLFWMLMMRRVR